VADDDGVSQGHLFLCHTGHGRDGRDTSGEPLQPSRVKQVMKSIGDKLEIKLHCHMLRHTWASEFARCNAGSVADLNDLLGHSSESMALYYTHSVNAKAVEKQKNNSPLDRRQRAVK
jgi:integrase